MEESNNLVLGKIGAKSTFSKTYEDSVTAIITSELLIDAINHPENTKVCLNENNLLKVVDIDLYESMKDKFTEVEVIGVTPFECSNGYGKIYRFLIEVIDKKALHAHLVDERMQIELNRQLLEGLTYGR